MTYDDITEATRQTLADFAESRRVLDLEEINGTLGFTHDCTSIIWRRDITPELIAQKEIFLPSRSVRNFCVKEKRIFSTVFNKRVV